MAPISLSGTPSVAQSGLAQFRLQQATRDAEQAEQVARSLQAQARDAQQQAGEAQQKARSIAAQATQAQSIAGQARRGVAAAETVGQLQTQLTNVNSQVTEKLKIALPTIRTRTAPAPVINSQGQITGTLINTIA